MRVLLPEDPAATASSGTKMGYLIERIPDVSLGAWHRWLTILAILIPAVGVIIGGFVGWAAYLVGKRLADADATATSLAIQQAKERIDYFDVAKLSAIGLQGNVAPPLEEHTQLNNLLSLYINVAPFFWDCKPEAVAAYDAAIKLNDKFPFPYFYRGACAKMLNRGGWQVDIDAARRILLITTKIPGHHPNHDEVFGMIESAGSVLPCQVGAWVWTD